MIDIKRRHTAGRGVHYVIVLDPDAYWTLEAAVEVAFEDPESVPPEMAAKAGLLWEAFANARERAAR